MIDVGPDGGDGGGKIVAAGVPEVIAHTKGSFTGEALKPLLASAPTSRKTERPKASVRPVTRTVTMRPAASKAPTTKRPPAKS